ncbi:MAG: glycoside hydrolase family 38 C-terminal domain-containing protein, partial [Bacteroidales bacterium]
TEKNAGNPTIFAIGHAHIDPVWRWNKDEGYAEVFATFRSALDRMKEYPGVAFIASSAQFYEWVAKTDVTMFNEIKKRVDEGRWNIVGGWWIEPDLNCPLGESLIRQGLYGQLFFQKNFSKKSKVGFNPDSFGHPWTLPQILTSQELEAYCFMRPNITEKPGIPAPLFNWQGLDGTKILAVQIAGSYDYEKSKDFETYLGKIKERYAKDLPKINTFPFFYGVGNHGGGPTIANIKKIKELAAGKCPNMHFGTLEGFVNQIKSMQNSFPLLDDELQHHSCGCYSACSDIKMWNRQAEIALLSAEKISSLTTVLFNTLDQTDRLKESWKKVLFNQFHDILAGTAIESAYIDAHNDLGYAMSEAKDIQSTGMQKLVMNVNTADTAFKNSIPFIVFNPCSWAVKNYIHVEMERSDYRISPVLYNSDGKEVTYQEVRTAGARVKWRVSGIFEAEIPAFGYEIFRMDFSNIKKPAKSDEKMKITENSLENEFVKIVFDKQTGYISSYFDKKNNRELLSKPGAVPIVLNDPGDTWGHNIVAYDQVIGQFEKPEFTIMETGPERASLQVKMFYDYSFIIQNYSLYKNSGELDCMVTLDWHEIQKMLKISIPTVLPKGKLTYSIPYGFIERQMNGNEEPGQTWIDISGNDTRGTFGISLLNDSKCGYSVKDGDMQLTVLHSTAWSHHIPDTVHVNDGYRYMEQGIHEFKYKLIPHNGDWRDGNTAGKSEEYLMKPIVFLTNNHTGALPKKNSFITLTGEGISISAAKMAEDGNGWVLRFVELNGKETKAGIEIKSVNKSVDFTMKPCEIKTFLIPINKIPGGIKEVNVLEE